MENLLDFIIKYQTIITTVLIFFAILACIYFISNRAGSTYSFINKLWSFTLGKKEFNNKKMASLWSERNDIEHFNTLFNMQFKSITQFNIFYDWLKKFDIDIRSISRVRRYFNIDKLKIKKVPRFHCLIVLFITAASFILSVVTINFLGYKDALVSFKAGGNSFWLNEAYASTFYNISSNRLILNKKSCNNKTEVSEFRERLAITEEQVSSICKSFDDLKDSAFIKKAVAEQRAALGVLFTIFAIATIIFSKKLLRMFSTYDARVAIRKQLRNYRKIANNAKI